MSEYQLAPIVLFVYNRPEHTRRTLQALSENILASESSLFVYSDGPKDPTNDEQTRLVESTREIVLSRKWCKDVRLITSPTNKGLAPSLIHGISEIIEEYGSVIVLEDDIVTSPYFLQYMNDGLKLYESYEKVASIHGYVYPVSGVLPNYFFIKGADCWGWATWRRAWMHFQANGQTLMDELKRQNKLSVFDFNGAMSYSSMLKDQISGKISSWAVRWYASALLNNMVTLYPATSFVTNIGFDGSGTHCDIDSSYNAMLIDHYVPPRLIKIKENRRARSLFIKYFRKVSGSNTLFIRKILKHLRRFKKQ